jgi:hypothetical protein
MTEQSQPGPVRYVLHPGYVVSANDGDNHYVGYGALIRLYGLNHCENQVVFSRDRSCLDQPGDVHLYPRYDGDYSLPSANFLGREVKP